MRVYNNPSIVWSTRVSRRREWESKSSGIIVHLLTKLRIRLWAWAFAKSRAYSDLSLQNVSQPWISLSLSLFHSAYPITRELSGISISPTNAISTVHYHHRIDIYFSFLALAHTWSDRILKREGPLCAFAGDKSGLIARGLHIDA